MRSKFNLTKSRFLLDTDRFLTTIIELHQIFSPIIWIHKSDTICEHQSIFYRERTSCIDFATSTCRNIGFDSAFHQFDFPWCNRKIFCCLNISTHRFWTLFLGKEWCHMTTNQNFFHSIKKSKKTDSILAMSRANARSSQSKILDIKEVSERSLNFFELMRANYRKALHKYSFDIYLAAVWSQILEGQSPCTLVEKFQKPEFLLHWEEGFHKPYYHLRNRAWVFPLRSPFLEDRNTEHKAGTSYRDTLLKYVISSQ